MYVHKWLRGERYVCRMQPASQSSATMLDHAHDSDRPAPPISLREEKKEITRRALIDEAVRRFRANGYDATTLDEIAAASQDLWLRGVEGETLRFERREGGL